MAVAHHVHPHLLPFQSGERLQVFVVKREGLAVEGHQAVALLQAGLFRAGTGGKLIHYKGYARHGQRFFGFNCLLDKGVGNGQRNDGSVAVHFHRAAAAQQDFHLHGREVGDGFSVDGHYLVTALKAQLFTGFQGPNAVLQVFGGYVLLAPIGHDAGVNDDGQKEINGDAAQEDDEALPRLFAAEFPGFGGFFQGLGVHAFVHHAGNLHVAAQGQPAQAYFRVANFLFEDGEPGVEKEVKFLHAGFEGDGGEEVSQLVEHDENGQAEDELRELNGHRMKEKITRFGGRTKVRGIPVCTFVGMLEHRLEDALLDLSNAGDTEIRPLGPGHALLLHQNRSFEVRIVAHQPEQKKVRLLINGQDCTVKSSTALDRLLESMGMGGGAVRKVKEVKAPMPGMVLRVEVAPGQEVQEGDPLLVLEAMKMENNLKSPASGTVKSVHVEAGKAVEKGAVLVVFA